MYNAANYSFASIYVCTLLVHRSRELATPHIQRKNSLMVASFFYHINLRCLHFVIVDVVSDYLHDQFYLHYLSWTLIPY